MSEQWLHIEQELTNLKAVDGGFSGAQCGLLSLSNGQEAFVKVGLNGDTRKWAKKEIAVYRFLQKHNYSHAPRLLAVSDDESGFAIEAFTVADGWDWHSNWSERRLAATLEAMEDLASIPLDDAERAFFAESKISQANNGWQPLLDSAEKQELLLKKLRGVAAEDVTKELDFSAEAKRGAAYRFADDTLVHYDMRADNCAYNKATGRVTVIDWNWTQLGDRDIELAATLSGVKKSGYDLSDDIIRRLNPDALHWMAGFWFDAATTPIWEGGPENLRDFQLQSGVTAFRLAQQRRDIG